MEIDKIDFHWRPGRSAVKFPKEGNMLGKKKIAGIGAIVLAMTALTGSLQGSNAAFRSGTSITKGPNGETATACSTVKLTTAQSIAVRKGKFTAALLWHTSSDFVTAVNFGASTKLKAMGIKVVATGDAQFDTAKQKANVDNAMAKKPSLIIGLPFDGVAAAAAYKSAVAAKTKLVFLSNLPDKFTYGNEYVTLVTDDLAQMGIKAADSLATAMGGKGEVGYIFHDAAYYVTNQRDQAFKARIESKYPNMKIVSEQGLTDPAKGQEIAQAMLAKNPNIGGIYVTWAQPAEGVLAALKAAGNKTTKIVTLDLSEPLAVDMVRNGNVASLTADAAYSLGECMAVAGAIGLLNGKVAPFLIAPALTVTASNVEEGWRLSLNRALPAIIKQELN
jgi:ribose transport system substrate-binding protein